MWPPMSLLVISPKHERVSYTWKRKGSCAEKWESIKIPTYTSTLYVDTAMEYKCSVDDTRVMFKVQGKKSSL